MPRDIFVIDDQHPEDIAMLQALYSRSPASVAVHLERLAKVDSGKFMDQYYVGYGHASIGDCGATTCFIEQVSILADKAIQDTPLYNGQEASTRYLDFSQQSVVDPYNNPLSRAIQDKWMELYQTILPQLITAMERRYPFNAAEFKSEKVWQNAVKARAFDVARGLLPMGVTTLLSWSTTLRHARDHLRRLQHHPLPELRETAREVFLKLRERYPNSFRANDIGGGKNENTPTLPPRDEYMERHALSTNYLASEDAMLRYNITESDMTAMHGGEIVVRHQAIDIKGLEKFESNVLEGRPAYTPLPWRLEAYGRYNFLFLLDFGSFRDIQRHRNAVCQIPLVDGRFGMHSWYVDQLRDNLSATTFEELMTVVRAQYAAIAAIGEQIAGTSPVLNQYLFPMGTAALVHTAYSLPETVYVGELRSSKAVHPSLRPIAQNMLRIMAHDLPFMTLHGDMDTDSWTAKRGEQDISEKALA